MYRSIQKLSLILLLLMSSTRLFAAVATLDWSDYVADWSPGATSFTATNISGTGINATITLTMVGSGTFSTNYPAIGFAPISDSLYNDDLQINVNSFTSKTADSVNVSIVFSKPVSNVVLPFHDVDRGAGTSTYTFVDVITFLPPSPSPVSLTGTPGNNQTSGTFQVYGTKSTGDHTDAGNATATFGSAQLTSYGFNYSSNNTKSQADPTAQAIGLGDITFTYTIVPEAGNVAGLFLVGMALCYSRKWLSKGV